MKALQEYERSLGRPLTDAEIEICVQSWSDHCYHTTWKSLGLMNKLMGATAEIDHPDVVSVFRDNAGGLALTEDWVVTIKGETHNFPSAIATFGGVATKHGGVIRDSIGFGRGGYPIGGSTIMGTMDPRLPAGQVPAGALPPGHIVRESIRATAYYCNPMGIPMMYSLYRAHPGYPKCLALGHSLGLIPREYALKDDSAARRRRPAHRRAHRPRRPARRDGIVRRDGAETKAKEAAAVQIGHPITERKFMEAVPVLRDAGCIRSITDLGAGGLSCAAGEMGEETGIILRPGHGTAEGCLPDCLGDPALRVPGANVDRGSPCEAGSRPVHPGALRCHGRQGRRVHLDAPLPGDLARGDGGGHGHGVPLGRLSDRRGRDKR